MQLDGVFQKTGIEASELARCWREINQALVVKNALAAQDCSQLFLAARPWPSSGHVTLYLIGAEVAADRLAKRPNMINMLVPHRGRLLTRQS